MDAQNANSGAAANDLQNGTSSDGRDDTFFLPADFPGADALEEGETITLKVVAKTEDGIEVEHIADQEPDSDDQDDIGAALGKHMAGSKSY